MFFPEKLQDDVRQFWREKLLYQGVGYVKEPVEGLGKDVIEGAGMPLRGWIENPGQKKGLVFFGGNLMSLHPFRDSKRYTDRTTYLFPYRGYEGQKGTPTSVDLIEDALCVVQEALKRHPNGVSVLGVSLGTGIAMQVASQVSLDSLILITPYDDITHVMQQYCLGVPVDRLLDESLNSKKVAPHITCPVSILKAEFDSIVPSSSTNALIEAFHRPVHVETYPDTHIGLWKSKSRPWTLDFIRRNVEMTKFLPSKSMKV